MKVLKYSIIIPQRNSIHTLSRLFDSIPVREDIEIIVVDNSSVPVTKEDIGIDRDYQLLWSAPERYAGGARNVGIENAHGKWLLFADADDFFAEGAFDVFDSNSDSTTDIIYTGIRGIYLDSGEESDRGEMYVKLIRNYIDDKSNEKNENELRYRFYPPYCKLIKRELVERHQLRFDEILAGNDVCFSAKCGYYAKTVEAFDCVTYVVTVSRGSLTRRRDYGAMKSRLYSVINYNRFFKEKGLPNQQKSVMYVMYESRYLGVGVLWEFFKILIKCRQNIFIGYRNWLKTYRRIKSQDQRDEKYIVR